MADIVVSRAGANAICELLALKKPSLLIPLPANASRGDQILNAKSFESQGFSMVADEDYLTAVILTEKFMSCILQDNPILTPCKTATSKTLLIRLQH